MATEPIDPEVQKIIDQRRQESGDFGLVKKTASQSSSAQDPNAFDFGTGDDDWGAPSVTPSKNSDSVNAAKIGAGVGAAAKYAGFGFGDRFLEPAPGLFSPSTPTTSAPVAVDQSHPLDPHIDAARADLANSRQIADAQLRRITGDPKATTAGYTQDQIDRLFAGGNKDTLDTSGRSRQQTYLDETSRLSDVNSLNRENLGKSGLDPREAISNAGPMVTLENGLQVPPQTALELSRQQQENAREQARLLAQQHAAQLSSQQAHLNTLEESRALDLSRRTQDAAQIEADAARRARVRGYAGGAAKMGAGALGLAEAFPQAASMYQDYETKKPMDWTKAASVLGGLATTFGGNKSGVLGQAAHIPYLVKHRDEIARGMKMEDVMPDTMRNFLAPGEGQEPAFSVLQKP